MTKISHTQIHYVRLHNDELTNIFVRIFFFNNLCIKNKTIFLHERPVSVQNICLKTTDDQYQTRTWDFNYFSSCFITIEGFTINKASYTSTFIVSFDLSLANLFLSTGT